MLWCDIIPEDRGEHLDYFVIRTFPQRLGLDNGFLGWICDFRYTILYFCVLCSYFNLLFAFFQIWPIVN